MHGFADNEGCHRPPEHAHPCFVFGGQEREHRDWCQASRHVHYHAWMGIRCVKVHGCAEDKGYLVCLNTLVPALCGAITRKGT
eukprot:1159586-Pelagomonas_calceolata.AAC.2